MTIRLPATLTSALIAALYAGPLSADLTITSPAMRAELRHPVALIRGEANATDSVRIENTSATGEDAVAETVVDAGRFVALVRLEPGRNLLRVTSADEECSWLLHYRPATTDHRVRVVYLVGSEGDSAYPTQIADDPQNYAEKLRTAAELMQTFTAEVMEAHGLGRLTFALERDGAGRVVVDAVVLPETAEELRSRDPGDQWQRTHAFLASRYDLERTKVLAMNAFIAYDSESGVMRGHTALGGGALAVFSANSLYAWPSSLGDVQRALGDATTVDTSVVADDTAGRGTLWAMAATGIGAWLHELGHTFGLPHSNDGRAIMARGFDLFNRTFCVTEPPCNHHSEPLLFTEDQTAYWDPNFARRLAVNPWFRPDGPLSSDQPGPEIAFDWDRDTLSVRAPAGLAVAQVEMPDGHIVDLWDVAVERQGTLTIGREDLASELGADDVRVVAFDRCGRSAALETASLKRPEWFITAWHFAPRAGDWAPPAAPELSEEAVAELEAELLEAPLADHRPPREAGHFSADLSALYGPRGNAVAYAARRLVAAEDLEAVLSCGGDDGLRAWLNGELVLDHTGVHTAPPDRWQTSVRLREGENVLLIETQQGPGAWLMSVRLTLPTGEPLIVDPEGRLVAPE